MMPTCFFFLFSSSFFLFSNPLNSLSDHCYMRAHYNASSVFMTHSHYTAMQELQIVNLIITDSNRIVSVMIRLLKFHFSYFRESLTPYYLLFPNFIFRPLLSRKCIIIYLLLFLSGNIHPNPVPVQFHKFNDTSSSSTQNKNSSAKCLLCMQ